MFSQDWIRDGVPKFVIVNTLVTQTIQYNGVFFKDFMKCLYVCEFMAQPKRKAVIGADKYHIANSTVHFET